MEREWSGNARRLSQADRTEIERRIWSGETFATAAAAGLLHKVDTAVSGAHGRPQTPGEGAISTSPVTCGAGGTFARARRRRFATHDRDATAAGTVNDLA